MRSRHLAAVAAPAAAAAFLLTSVGSSTAEDQSPAAAPAPAPAPTVVEPDQCPVRYSQVTFGRYVRAVYRRPRVSRRAHDQLRRMKACALSTEASNAMERVQVREAGKRQARARAAREAARYVIPVGHPLRAIALCESGGDPTAVSASGTYRGKYQFDYGTWASVGGDGDPAGASETEQDKRAMILYSRRGAQPWPVCGS